MYKTWQAAAVACLAAVWLVGCGEQAGREAASSTTGKATRDATAEMPPPRADKEAHAPTKAAAEACMAEVSLGASAPADEAATLETTAPVSPSTTPLPAENVHKDREANRNLQSGTLTAGSFGDIERFADYQEFLSTAMQQDVAEILPRWAIGERVMIQVVTSNGEPVADARVAVRSVDAGPSRQSNNANAALLDMTTASDGRVMFLTGMDGPSRNGEYHVTVSRPRDEPVTHTVRADQQPWRIVLTDTQAQLPKRLDLALVIDTTGSMGDELEYLKVEIDSIAQAIHEMFPNVEQRYALILYRDEGDQYVTRKFDFTTSLADFRKKLAEQSAGGGGDYPEAVHLAMEQAGELSWRDEETARVMFFVADAPPHDRHADRTLDAVDVLRRQGVRIYPVASSGVGLKAEFVMRAASFLTLAQYLFLTDHSGVGNPHEKPHVPEYQVERLDRLMIRMISAELSGRRLTPEEVIAIERGERAVPRPMFEEPLPPEQPPAGAVSMAQPRRANRAASHGAAWAVLKRLPPWVLVLAICGVIYMVDAVAPGRRAG